MSDTVRVRVPVLVTHDGRWMAEGWAGMDGAKNSGALTVMLDAMEPEGPWTVHWIEADVPVPAAELTFQGAHKREAP